MHGVSGPKKCNAAESTKTAYFGSFCRVFTESSRFSVVLMDGSKEGMPKTLPAPHPPPLLGRRYPFVYCGIWTGAPVSPHDTLSSPGTRHSSLCASVHASTHAACFPLFSGACLRVTSSATPECLSLPGFQLGGVACHTGRDDGFLM